MKKIFILISILFIINIISAITSDTITTTIYEESDRLDQTKKTIEISDNVFSEGTELLINNNENIFFSIQTKTYSFMISDIKSDSFNIILFGEKVINLKINEKIDIDINNDEIPDLRLNYKNYEDLQARISIIKYEESIDDQYIKNDYKELFDIEVEVSENKIPQAKYLTLFIKFVNFGEGPSRINIVYTIFNESGEEVYTGFDDKVVYTQESLIKHFKFLSLPEGNYKVSAEIFYGKNQSAISENNFQIIQEGSPKAVNMILIFVVIIIVFFLFLHFMLSRKNQNLLLKKSN